METTGATARRGLIMGLAGVEAALTLTASAARHAGWWVDWHTRTEPGSALHRLTADQPVKAALRMVHMA
jgi:hypothetical protein